MDYKVLYRKYRPDNFNDLVGQDHIKEFLLQSILTNKLSHAYLFTGPRGTGKTSTAKLFAKIINCENHIEGNPCEKCNPCLNYNNSADIVEIDAASNNGVDEIRELRDNVKIAPTMSKYKVYIIDEVHMLSSSAWNAFLKTLEEPPNHVIFILATTEIYKVPITVMSRCQRFDFQKISEEVIVNKLKEITKKEKIKIDDEVLLELAKLSDGGLRDALGLLDQLSKLSGKITLDTLKNSYGILTKKDVDDFITLYKDNKITEFINLLNSFNERGVSGDVLLNHLLESLLSELIKYKTTGSKEIANVDNLIIDLEECYQKRNQYLLIKTVLVKNIDTSILEKEAVLSETNLAKKGTIISREIISEEKPEEISDENLSKKGSIISREIISEPKKETIESKIIDIRINNSFVDADKTLKEQLLNDWITLIEHFSNTGETKFLSLFENSTIEVVSPTNVLISTNTFTNSVLFNSLSDELSEEVKKIVKKDLKFVFIDKERWLEERNIYISNKDKKTYELMDEPEIIKDNQTAVKAEEIFGETLVEVK